MQTIDMKKAAALINAKPRKLIDALEKSGIFTRDSNGTRIAKHEFLEKGYFVNEFTSINKGTHRELRHTTKVTSRGVAFLQYFINTQINTASILKTTEAAHANKNESLRLA